MNATKLNGKPRGRKVASPARRSAASLALRRDTRRRLILRCWYSLGDIVLLTAAVRDLHRAYPRQFLTDVRTPFDDLWLHNPWITPLRDDEAETVECDFALLEESNRAPYHALHSFIEDLNRKLDLRIRPTEFRGDIHLHPLERAWTPQVAEVLGFDVPYWVIVAGGKSDCTIKWWATERWQAVVDHFRGRILFVQAGASADPHPALQGVLDLRGQTDVRQLIRLVHHSEGVLCPVTSLMHLAAAVPPPADRPQNRACVVVAGGREPVQWEAYPHHQFLHTLGALHCCDHGGCWKTKTVLRDASDDTPAERVCVEPVWSGPRHCGTPLPRCMHMITRNDVTRVIERYHEAAVCREVPARRRKRLSAIITHGSSAPHLSS